MSARTDFILPASCRPPHYGLVLVDRISIGLGYLLLVFSAANAIDGFFTLALSALAASLFPFMIRHINQRGWHSWSTRLSVFGTNATIFVFASLLGKPVLVQNYFFAAIGLPVLICPVQARGCKIAGTLLPVLLFAMLEGTAYSPLAALPRIPAPPWMPYANVVGCFAFCALLVFEFYRIAGKAERSLRSGQEKILAASKLSALGEMAGGIAHEINNPLSSIVLLSTQIRALALKDEPSRDAILQCVDKIHVTVRRITTIIRALSTFSRDTGRDPMTRESLGKIVHETCGICLDKFANHGVELRISVKDRGAIIECNAVQISQILVNLLNNAYDAVQGCKDRWVQIETKDWGAVVELTVTDSGPGIPLEARERLFEPFFTTKNAGHGTGLGLSVSSNIARHHNGELSLDGASKQTRFRLLLPKEQPLTSGRSREGAGPDTPRRSKPESAAPLFADAGKAASNT